MMSANCRQRVRIIPRAAPISSPASQCQPYHTNNPEPAKAPRNQVQIFSTIEFIFRFFLLYASRKYKYFKNAEFWMKIYIRNTQSVKSDSQSLNF